MLHLQTGVVSSVNVTFTCYLKIQLFQFYILETPLCSSGLHVTVAQ